MRKSVCRILWTLPVLTMLLVNNPVSFAQSTEETTTIIQSKQNLSEPQENNDPQSKANVTVLYLQLNHLLPLDLVNSDSNGTDYVYLKNNGTIIWGPVTVSGSNFYDMKTTINVSSTSSVRLELFDQNSGRSLGKISTSFNTLKKIIDQSDRYLPTLTNSWYSSATWKYKLNYQVKSTNSSSSDFSARAQAASIPQLSWPCSARGINLAFDGDWPYTTIDSCKNLVWRHTGIDINASAGSDVYAAEAGTVKISKSSGSKWKDYIVLEHKDSQGNKYTTVYWHLNRKISVNQSVTRGQKIAVVANMGGGNMGTHLHFGIYNAEYDKSPRSIRGGLPTTKCSSLYPDEIYPGKFVDPSKYLP